MGKGEWWFYLRRSFDLRHHVHSDDTHDSDFAFATEIQLQAIVFGLEHEEWQMAKDAFRSLTGKTVAERGRALFSEKGEPVTLKSLRGGMYSFC